MTRVGVIGAGAIARREHLPQLVAAGATITAIAARTTESAAAAAAEHGGAVVADWRDLVTRDDVDAVVICTPNAQHAPQALAAIAAGKHVLVEKPFTITVAEADAVLAAAADKGVVAMTAHNGRFNPIVQALQRAVQAGQVGDVTAVRGVFCHPGPLDWSAAASWFLELEESGGGALLDLGVHLVDSLRFILADEVQQVSATLAGQMNGVERDGLVLLDTRAGVVGTLHAGWRSTAGPDFSLTVAGSDATLVGDLSGVRLIDRDGQATAVTPPTDVPTVQQVFLDAVAGGRAQHPDGYDGRAAVAVVQACYTSAREGCSITV